MAYELYLKKTKYILILKIQTYKFYLKENWKLTTSNHYCLAKECLCSTSRVYLKDNLKNKQTTRFRLSPHVSCQKKKINKNPNTKIRTI